MAGSFLSLMPDAFAWVSLSRMKAGGPRGGKPFTRNGIRCRFRRLREKVPHLACVISYTYRHGFATDALVNGVGIAEVAELLGHKDLTMIQEHYSHLAEKRDHLRRAAERATPPPEA